MQYTIKAHPTKYRGVQFRSRLEATWAAAFDLEGLVWQYEPIDLPGWSPDFYLEVPCGHSECYGKHTFFCEVKPYFSIEAFKGHPCMDYAYGCKFSKDGDDRKNEVLPVDGTFALGANPRVTRCEIGHGAGGGWFDLPFFAMDIEENFVAAANLVQWQCRHLRWSEP